MPLELSVLIALAAVVMCVLRGRSWWAVGVIAALAIGIVGTVSIAADMDEDVLGAVLVTGVPLAIALGAVWLAAQPAVPGSYWSRLGATDESGARLIDKESGLARFGRSVVGAFLGTLPAITFMVVAILAARTSDETQLAFAGIPFLFIGFIVGGIIGFHWVPKSAVRKSGGSPPLLLT